jgi:hypothetical protein
MVVWYLFGISRFSFCAKSISNSGLESFGVIDFESIIAIVVEFQYLMYT